MRVVCPECGSKIRITHGPREYSKETREHYGGCEQCNRRFKVLISVTQVRQLARKEKPEKLKGGLLASEIP